MARIRTVALGAALFAATVGAVSAQTTQGTPRTDSAAKAGDGRKGGPGPRRGERGRGGPGMMGREGMPGMDFMRGLNLTETQRTQVRAIHEKYQPQMQTLHERARTEFEATRLHEQMFREVRTVLTAEQRAKIEAQLAERIKKLDEDKARLERLRR